MVPFRAVRRRIPAVDQPRHINGGVVNLLVCLGGGGGVVGGVGGRRVDGVGGRRVSLRSGSCCCLRCAADVGGATLGDLVVGGGGGGGGGDGAADLALLGGGDLLGVVSPRGPFGSGSAPASSGLAAI